MSEPYGARAGAPDGAPAGPEIDAVPEEGGVSGSSGERGDEQAGRSDEERSTPDVGPDHVTTAAPGEGAEEEGGSSEPEQEDGRLVALTTQRDEYLDALRRVQADFENYRKRILRQQTELLDRAAFDLVGKLLPVLDTIDLARAHAEGDPSSDGLNQVATTANDVLSREGLERLDPIGQPFDPALHEAVAHEEATGDSDKPQVSEVLRPGYRWKGQLLRPAMVKVTG
jgi:molecular chaperone GrpE